MSPTLKVSAVGRGMSVNEPYTVIDYKFEMYTFALSLYSAVFAPSCIFHSILNQK